MYHFTNSFTGQKFLGSVNQLHRMLTGEDESIFDKTDVIKSHGWTWDPFHVILK
jgi:hypothetical protein